MIPHALQSWGLTSMLLCSWKAPKTVEPPTPSPYTRLENLKAQGPRPMPLLPRSVSSAAFTGRDMVRCSKSQALDACRFVEDQFGSSVGPETLRHWNQLHARPQRNLDAKMMQHVHNHLGLASHTGVCVSTLQDLKAAPQFERPA